ncbi:MAG: alpha/beta fold hydrolase [Alphaproteobacteria bacterium]|nr:alpha/beta fold hydrolase [Alphaproteobacteria bacterium]
MTQVLDAPLQDRFVEAAGLKLRYIEAGQGHPVIFLHGASLGSSADVFIRTIRDFAAQGFRAIAFDQPGFGLSENPEDHSNAFRRKAIPQFIAAFGLKQCALAAHSQAGSMAAQLALETPELYSHVVVLGTGSLLPPLEEKKEGLDGAAQQRLERRMAQSEPSMDDTRKLLEANLFHHELITPEELELRHARSIGKNFTAFVARSEHASAPAKKASDAKPLWRRLAELKMPLLLIYGRNDRANAFERATKLKEQLPQLDLHIVPDCKHLVPWDAQTDVLRLAVPFLKKQ